MSKRSIIVAVVLIVVIAVAWFAFDYRSPYPIGPDELLNASSTKAAEIDSTTANSAADSSRSTINSSNAKTAENFMHTITIETSKGTIKFETYDADAPKTVENFIKLSNQGFYNGLSFHRVISGFMIQGGDPLGNGTGGPGYKFADELDPNTSSYKAGYVRGTVAMANAGPNTNGSQFFIMHQDYALPHNYTIFGRVISGLDVVDKIAAVKTDGSDKPLEDVKMIKVTVAAK